MKPFGRCFPKEFRKGITEMLKAKKIIAFILTVVMTVTCMPVSLASDGDNQVTDTVRNPDVILIPKEEQTAEPEETVIPELLELAPEDLSVSTLPGDRLESLKALLPQEKRNNIFMLWFAQAMNLATPLKNEAYVGYAAFDIAMAEPEEAGQYLVNVQLNNPIEVPQEENAVIDRFGKTVKVTGAASVYTALSGLKQKTTYSVRMRTFRKVGQRTFYSVWSKVRTLKTMVAAAHTIDGQLPAGKRVPVSYFDDVVFVGDSITEGLRYYAMASGALGNAKFLSAVSLSATNALWNVSDRSKHPRWNGQKMKLEQSVPLTGAKKVYVMLGMNDITSVGVDRSVTNIETVCSNILKAAPDVQIYIESITPRANVQADDIGVLNNTSITRCNEKLAALCLKRGWYFVNVAEAMFDGNGYFKSEYCSDRSSMGMHFTYPGCAAWVDYLYTHTV